MADVKHGTETPKHLIMSSELPPGGPVTLNKLPSIIAGGPASGQGFIPTFADACKLVSAPYSCLVLDTHRRHIGLAPMYIKRKRTGIQEELDTELLKYSEKLKGVPLAYDHISILGAQGDICDDNGYIHMDIAASFVVFNPEPGQKLLGIVNKLGASHVGCLVHGCFNASIPKPNLISVDTWREMGPRIGAGLEFEVNQIDADQVGVLLIRGRLERTKVQEMLAMAECMECIVTDHQTSPSAPEAPEETPKKKKKKRDKQHAVQTEGDVRQEPDEDGEVSRAVKQEREEEEEWTASRGGDQHLDGATDSPPASEKKKKKKKKKKDEGPKDEGQEQAVTVPEQHGSDSSGYLSDKPSRKRRLEMAVEIIPCPREDPQRPKSKKKRKSDA
ncbi:DNA-directed RNA polymerase I subunit RPA43 [Gadus chalcogrammus]|uniref:DNA-directed RNA polymerase I subunit RPA43 n=1 Tax=Gadus chalcogrammus TaxID=1042646 RepID=UPI0024C4DC56|nr:DNA-directed RNA polymerase I subunit RPA43 [Gadus chalcogrammus]